MDRGRGSRKWDHDVKLYWEWKTKGIQRNGNAASRKGWLIVSNAVEGWEGSLGGGHSLCERLKWPSREQSQWRVQFGYQELEWSCGGEEKGVNADGSSENVVEKGWFEIGQGKFCVVENVSYGLTGWGPLESKLGWEGKKGWERIGGWWKSLGGRKATSARAASRHLRPDTDNRVSSWTVVKPLLHAGTVMGNTVASHLSHRLERLYDPEGQRLYVDYFTSACHREWRVSVYLSTHRRASCPCPTASFLSPFLMICGGTCDAYDTPEFDACDKPTFTLLPPSLFSVPCHLGSCSSWNVDE